MNERSSSHMLRRGIKACPNGTPESSPVLQRRGKGPMSSFSSVPEGRLILFVV